jgi:hypothetical protein
MSIVESSMSCHIGEQLGYDQPKLPAAFALKPQIIRRKQETYTQPVQSVFRDAEAKMLEIPCGVGQVPRIRHAHCLVNISVTMQEVYHIKERGLDCHVIRLHRFGRNRADSASELVIHSVVQLAKKQRSIGIR